MRKVVMLMIAILLVIGVSTSAVAASNPCAKQGNGSASKPYLLCKANDLELVRSHPAAVFSVLANLDLNGYDAASAWAALSNFSGKIDGKGHSIANLKGSYGLFGLTQVGSVITNLSLTNVNIDGQLGNGAVAAYNYGTINNVSVSGTVKGRWQTGAIAGYNYGEVKNSHSSGIVSGSTTIGGLVGLNADGATIKNSASSSKVSGSLFVGGLVGTNGGVLQSVQASGSVGATSSQVGGLLGNNEGTGEVKNSSASGNVYRDPLTDTAGTLFGSNQGQISRSIGSGNLLDIGLFQ